jgi:hypothetical protein
MLEFIQVLPVDDGGNPRTEFDIKKGKDGFLIHPFSEDDDGNYRFRLNVKVVNHSNKKIPVKFNIEWGDVEYQEDRRYLLLSKEEDHWERFEAEINGTIASATIDISPGRCYLCMHPRYNLGRFLNLVEGLPKDRFKLKVIGKTRRNRDIFAIEVGNENLKPLAIIARAHPYETMGSYLVDGMLKWLSSNEEDILKFISENRIIFIPMLNPDGVFEGTCKLTLGGLNFEAGNADNSTEPEGVAVREYLLSMNPSVVFDLHGWMYSHHILLTNDTVKGSAFHENLSSNKDLFNNAISIVYRDYPQWGGKKNIGGFIALKLKSIYIDSSWSWYGKDAKTLGSMGVTLLKEYAKIYR